MSSIGDRLREERERLGLNQTQLAELAGTTRKSQFNYETNARKADSDYLVAVAAAGVDVLYVLTGEKAGSPAASLTAEEQTMLAYFREASKEVRRAALGALLGAAPGPGPLATGSHGQVSTGAGALHIGTMEAKPGTKRRK